MPMLHEGVTAVCPVANLDYLVGTCGQDPDQNGTTSVASVRDRDQVRFTISTTLDAHGDYRIVEDSGFAYRIAIKGMDGASPVHVTALVIGG